jgi:AraC family transcriptional regulator
VQTTGRVRVENGQLVTKSENLRLQGNAGPKNGGDQSKKGDEKRLHRGDHYDLTGIVNLAFSARTEFSAATTHGDRFGGFSPAFLVGFGEDVNRFIALLDTPEVSIGRFDHPSDRPHYDPFKEVAAEYSVNRVEGGSFAVQVGRHCWTLGPGHVFLCYPGLQYRCHHGEPIPADLCVSVVYRDLGARQEGATPLAYLDRLARRQPVLQPTNRLAYIFRNVTFNTHIEDNGMAAEHSAADLLVELSGGAEDGRRLYPEHQLAWYAERIDAARHLLHQRYAAEHQLASLAHSVGMSTFHFARVFSELVGVPPHRYLQRVRLDEAARRLYQGASVTEACLSSGFRNLSHFIRTFQRRFGASPGKHRSRSVRR